MAFKNQDEYEIPSFAVSSISDGKISMKKRILNIFEDSKKRNGLLINTFIIIAVIVLGSILIFGDKNVKQTNDSLTIYTFGKQKPNYNIIAPYGSIITLSDETFNPTLDPYKVEKAVEEYKKLYPNVDVNIVDFDDGTHDSTYIYEKLYVELMAGKGPDVIIGDRNMCTQKDIYKMAKAGVFAPLDDYIKDDTKYQKYNYIEPVMNEGFYQGKRYLLPLRFSMNVLLSGKNTLTKAGINIENCKRDYIGYMNETNKYIMNNSSKSNNFFTKNMKLSEQLPYMDVVAMNGIVDKNTPDMKKLFELYKPIYNYEFSEPGVYDSDSTLIHENSKIFLPATQNSTVVFSADGIQSLQFLDEPVLVPIRRPNGGINAIIELFAGINASSHNQQNAYNFISMLIGPEAEFFYDKGISPNKDVATATMFSIGPSPFSNIYNVKTDSIPKQYVEEYVSFIDDIDNAFFLSPMDTEIYTQMKSFFTGKSSYDDCIKTIQQKMNLYETE